MMNIMPVSELKNYGKVLDSVKPDSPVFLTKNGYGKYAVIDLADYEAFDKFEKSRQLARILQRAEKSGTRSLDEVTAELLK